MSDLVIAGEKLLRTTLVDADTVGGDRLPFSFTFVRAFAVFVEVDTAGGDCSPLGFTFVEVFAMFVDVNADLYADTAPTGGDC